MAGWGTRQKGSTWKTPVFVVLRNGSFDRGFLTTGMAAVKSATFDLCAAQSPVHDIYHSTMHSKTITSFQEVSFPGFQEFDDCKSTSGFLAHHNRPSPSTLSKSRLLIAGNPAPLTLDESLSLTLKGYSKSGMLPIFNYVICSGDICKCFY
jgi:hypothetical protein